VLQGYITKKIKLSILLQITFIKVMLKRTVRLLWYTSSFCEVTKHLKDSLLYYPRQVLICQIRLTIKDINNIKTVNTRLTVFPVTVTGFYSTRHGMWQHWVITLRLSVPDSSLCRQYHSRITCRRTIKIKTDKSNSYKTQRNTVCLSCNHSAINVLTQIHRPTSTQNCLLNCSFNY